MVSGGGELVVRYGPSMVGRMMVIVWLLLGQKVIITMIDILKPPLHVMFSL